MKECIFGLAIGMLVGALLINNSPKTQEMLDKGSEMVKKKLDKLSKK